MTTIHWGMSLCESKGTHPPNVTPIHEIKPYEVGIINHHDPLVRPAIKALFPEGCGIGVVPLDAHDEAYASKAGSWNTRTEMACVVRW